MIVAVTGHRPDKLGGWKVPNPIYNDVVTNLKNSLLSLQPKFVLTGMALGVDQWTAELCIQYGIPFIAAIPCDNQDIKWPDFAKAKYQKLLSKAHKAYVISPGPYDPAKMHIRNEWMVKSCDTLMAVWNGSTGGTGSCVNYAKSVGKPIHMVPLPVSVTGVSPIDPLPLQSSLFGGGSSKPKFKVIQHFKTAKEVGKTPLAPFLESIKDKTELEMQKQKSSWKKDKPSKSKPAIPKSLNEMTQSELLKVIKGLVSVETQGGFSGIQEDLQKSLDGMLKYLGTDINYSPPYQPPSTKKAEEKEETKELVLDYKRVLED